MYICRRGRRTTLKITAGPPRLSYAVSRRKTTVLYLSQVPWLERRTSPPPMVSGSVFVVNAKIISHSAVFQRWNVTVSCSRWLTLARTVSQAASPPTPQSGLLRLNKCRFPLVLGRRASVPVRLLGVCWLPSEIKHLFCFLFSTWRESRAVLRSDSYRPLPTLSTPLPNLGTPKK